MTSRVAETMLTRLISAITSERDAAEHARALVEAARAHDDDGTSSNATPRPMTSPRGWIATRAASVASSTTATPMATMAGIDDSPSVTRFHAGSTTLSCERVDDRGAGVEQPVDPPSPSAHRSSHRRRRYLCGVASRRPARVAER